MRKSGCDPFPLNPHLSEDFLHLALIVGTQLLPESKHSRFKVVVDVVHRRILWSDSLSCGLRSLYLWPSSLLFLGLFPTFFLSLLPFLLFNSLLLNFLSGGTFLLIEISVDSLLKSGFSFQLGLKNRIENRLNRGRDLFLTGLSFELVQDALFFGVVTELREPVLKSLSTLIERDPSIN